MRVKRLASLALAGGTLAALVGVPTTAQAAATTLTIHVGGDSLVSGFVLEGMRFDAPSTINVHKGDILNFVFDGFHTATFIPVGVGAEDWRDDNTSGVSSPYSLVVPDTDDGAGQFMFNNAAVLPSDPSCGAPAAPCSYDGSSVVNSGAPFSDAPFAVTVDANPGDTFWVLCLIHGMMQTRVHVVANNENATTQSEIDNYASDRLAQDKLEAAALIPKLQTPTSHNTANGKVWDAYVGFDGPGWGLDGMFPKKLVVEKGDTVRWHSDQLVGNIHTVTFPKTEAGSLNHAFGEPICEADPTDTPPDLQGPPFCSSGPQNFELHIPGQALLPAGGHTYGGTGFVSSGIVGQDGLTTAPFDVKFTQRSGDTAFKYACIVHGTMMSGRVKVK